MDPCLGIWGPKMGPMFRDFLSKPTHLGGTSPYSISVGVPPGISLRRRQIYISVFRWENTTYLVKIVLFAVKKVEGRLFEGAKYSTGGC